VKFYSGFISADYYDDQHLQWELGAVSESDEEVLIEEDEDDRLQQVIVQQEQPSANTSFVDRVSGAIRKISSSSRFPAEAASSSSRKSSRNEPSTPVQRRRSESEE
jgi:hypothetical protein